MVKEWLIPHSLCFPPLDDRKKHGNPGNAKVAWRVAYLVLKSSFTIRGDAIRALSSG
jgi:hypothetical protein